MDLDRCHVAHLNSTRRLAILRHVHETDLTLNTLVIERAVVAADTLRATLIAIAGPLYRRTCACQSGKIHTDRTPQTAALLKQTLPCFLF